MSGYRMPTLPFSIAEAASIASGRNVRAVTTTDRKELDMALIAEVAGKFFEACETGKGWEGCKAYCTQEATFSAQASPLAEVKTLAQSIF